MSSGGLRIAVLGGGRVGGALAATWRAAGHEVAVSTRETVAQVAAGAEVVLLAVPAAAGRARATTRRSPGS